MGYTSTIEIHPRAELSIHYLAQGLQNQVWETIEHLSEEDSTKAKYQNIEGMEDTYIVKAPHDTRIIFSWKEDQVMVLDVIDAEKFQRLHTLYRGV